MKDSYSQEQAGTHLTTNVPRFGGAVKVSDPFPSVAAITIANIGVDSNRDASRGAPEATGAAAGLVAVALFARAMDIGAAEAMFPAMRLVVDQ